MNAHSPQHNDARTQSPNARSPHDTVPHPHTHTTWCHTRAQVHKHRPHIRRRARTRGTPAALPPHIRAHTSSRTGAHCRAPRGRSPFLSRLHSKPAGGTSGMGVGRGGEQTSLLRAAPLATGSPQLCFGLLSCSFLLFPPDTRSHTHTLTLPPRPPSPLSPFPHAHRCFQSALPLPFSFSSHRFGQWRSIRRVYTTHIRRFAPSLIPPCASLS